MHAQLGKIWLDVVPLSVLACVLLFTAAYLLSCSIVSRHRSGIHSPLRSGMFRLAASRGDLQTLACLAAACLDTDAALDGFTALHAACIQGQLGR